MSAQRVSQSLLMASLVMLAIGLVVLFMPQAAVAQCNDQNRRVVPVMRQRIP